MLQFEWDERKAESNLSKHGVIFEEAATAFDDVWARLCPIPIILAMRSVSCFWV